MPSLTEAREIVDRRHLEWAHHHVTWRWLLDSYEGGATYRDASYGWDTYGYPVKNLVRHKREFADIREGGVRAGIGDARNMPPTDSDYSLRLARTPVPTFVQEVVSDHLSRIYAREVQREPAPERLKAWWGDVDGTGTPIDAFMRQAVAPLLYVLGQVDVLIDHPPAPDGEDVSTRADVRRLGLDGAVASVVLPENVVWWRLEPRTRRYAEVLVREVGSDDEGRERVRYRHWTREVWTLYEADGEEIDAADHGFGRVPIVRLFDRRKPRCEHVGQSRLEATAERQREYYNRDSELVLSDSLQAHPTMQGPEDYIGADADIPVGPGWILPKKRDQSTGQVVYEGWDWLDPPKGAAESLRANKQGIRDDIDRDTHLMKPAGATTGGTVAQSGISKGFDHTALNNRLSEMADTFAEAERQVAELALSVLGIEGQSFEVTYPKQFDLFRPDELAALAVEIQGIASSGGAMPEVEGELLRGLVALALPGRTDGDYRRYGAEIDAYLAEQAKRREESYEALTMVRPDTTRAAVTVEAPAVAGGDDDSDDDPTSNPIPEG